MVNVTNRNYQSIFFQRNFQNERHTFKDLIFKKADQASCL